MSPSEFYARVEKWLKKDEIVNLTLRLVEKETVNPPGNEWLAREVVEESLRALGARIEVKEKEKGRTNIIGRIGGGKPEVAFITHLDVVPPGSGWSISPFFPRVKEGKIYGRGALDNKGPYAASWAAVKSLLKAKLNLRGTIILVCVADEEMGSEKGLRWLLEEGFKCDYALIPDAGKIDRVVVGEKGLLWVKCETRGKSAHASTPGKGENAILKMGEFLGRLSSFPLKKKIHSSFTPLTLNPGLIKGGSSPNTVPDRCEVLVDIRYPLGMDKETVLKNLQRLGEGKVEVKLLKYTLPHLVKNFPLLSSLIQAGREMGIEIKPETTGGNTLAKELYFKGIPSISHLPTRENVAHEADEWVEVDSLLICAKLWARTLYLTLGEN